MPEHGAHLGSDVRERLVVEDKASLDARRATAAMPRHLDLALQAGHARDLREG
jgi:hypothetical protein